MVRKFYYFIFTFICCDLFNVLYANSSLISEENLKTHLRLSLKVPKDQIVVKTDGLKLYIQTLNLDLFGKLVAELDKVPLNNNYFVNRFYSSNDYPNTPATITFHLKNNSIEAFAFYRKEIQDQVIDFWSNDMGGTSPPENSQTPKVVDSTIVPDQPHCIQFLITG